MLKPPMFSTSMPEDTPQQYLHRARMFRDAAIRMPDYSNGEQFWPKYALLTHAIELALKAFVRHSIAGSAQKRKEPSQHDLQGWHEQAIQNGLQREPVTEENIAVLNRLHMSYFSRYPQRPSAPIPDASAIADSTVDELITAFTQHINPR